MTDCSSSSTRCRAMNPKRDPTVEAGIAKKENKMSACDAMVQRVWRSDVSDTGTLVLQLQVPEEGQQHGQAGGYVIAMRLHSSTYCHRLLQKPVESVRTRCGRPFRRGCIYQSAETSPRTTGRDQALAWKQAWWCVTQYKSMLSLLTVSRSIVRCVYIRFSCCHCPAELGYVL